jgi:amidase
MTADVAWLSATELAARIRRRELSPVELMDATLARIAERNPSLTALVYVNEDESRAAARLAEQAVLDGAELGPLHGVPTAMKDLFDFKPGWPSTYGGIPAMRGFRAGPDLWCPWAARMEAAGAIIVGRSNSPVMGFRGTCDNPLYGPTRNPFDTTKNSGGSSGGAAAVVADGMLAIAEGGDGGGSIRIPAAWCGVYGYKAAAGRMPFLGRPNGFGSTHPFIHEGTLTRTVRDAAAALDVLAGYDDRDPHALPDAGPFAPAVDRPIAGMRIAYSPDLGGFPVVPAIRDAVAGAVGAFEEAGAVVEPVELQLPRDLQELSDAWCRMLIMHTVVGHERMAAEGYDLLGAHRDELPPQYLHWIEEGSRLSAAGLFRDNELRTEVYDMVAGTLREHDLLVTPTLACMPVDNADDGNTVGPSEVEGVAVDELIGWCLTYPINFSGHPAASVPAGLVDGLPVGMQIVGRRHADDDVLAASAAFERLRPWSGDYAIPSGRNLTVAGVRAHSIERTNDEEG